MIEAKHVDGPLFVHDFTDPVLGPDPKPCHVTLSCAHPDSITVASMGNGLTGTIEEARANAARLALAWNCHDDLVSSLSDLLLDFKCRLSGKHEPKHIEGFPEVIAARAALAKAGKQPRRRFLEPINHS